MQSGCSPCLRLSLSPFQLFFLDILITLIFLIFLLDLASECELKADYPPKYSLFGSKLKK